MQINNLVTDHWIFLYIFKKCKNGRGTQSKFQSVTEVKGLSKIVNLKKNIQHDYMEICYFTSRHSNLTDLAVDIDATQQHATHTLSQLAADVKATSSTNSTTYNF